MRSDARKRLAEQTDAAEVALTEEVYRTLDPDEYGWAMGDGPGIEEVVRAVLASTWLWAERAAAEARGAERALREAAEEFEAEDEPGRIVERLRALAAAQVACVDPSRGESGSTDPEVCQSADQTSAPSRVPGEES